MAERADKKVAQYLGSNDARLTLGENLFNGPSFPGAGLAVFCIVSGGALPVTIVGTTTGVYSSRVDIRIRGERGKYDEGVTFAKQVQQAIQYSQLGTDFIMVRVTGSSPAYIGQNNNGDPEWVIFTLVTFEE